MNANASRSGLIFVTNITVYIRGGKIVMWRNFSFPCMTIVGKLQCYLHVETFWEMLGNFATIYALLCGEKLSPKVHLWRKMTNMRSGKKWYTDTRKNEQVLVLILDFNFL